MQARVLWLALLALAMAACSPLPPESPEQKLRLAQSYLPNNDSCIDSTLRAEQLTRECVFGQERAIAEADFAVIGDSHAMVLMDAMKTLSSERGLTGVNLTMSGCPPFEFAVRTPARMSDIQCGMFRHQVLVAARAQQLPKTLLVHARWGIHFAAEPFNNGEGGIELDEYHVFSTPQTQALGHREALKHGLQAFLSELIDLNYHVIFVHSVPEMGWNVPARLQAIWDEEKRLAPASASVARSTYLARNQYIFAIIDELKRQYPQRLDEFFPHELFCEAQRSGRCFAHKNGSPLYYDDDHVSAVGAYLLLQELGNFNE
ncbi:hypothetical protein Ga0003345_0171 [Idiomarinaceae bacterium HL-53]|nr:hypothetical protein Ga0003345_0171 [Idiomarinaceae bacterium HL-53]